VGDKISSFFDKNTNENNTVTESETLDLIHNLQSIPVKKPKKKNTVESNYFLRSVFRKIRKKYN
jgi:hypothetical protein